MLQATTGPLVQYSASLWGYDPASQPHNPKLVDEIDARLHFPSNLHLQDDAEFIKCPHQKPVMPLKKKLSPRESSSGSSHTFDGWPNQARNLRPRSSRLGHVIVNVTLLLLAALFFAYATLIIVYNRQPIGIVERALFDAAHYGPTVFPILFAALVGRMMKSYSLWRLQEGERIGLLDLLLGSTSITNAVTTQVNLRSPSLTAVFVLLLWALSPIGGQASLRALSFEESSVVEQDNLQYLDVNNTWVYYMATNVGRSISPVNALFLASLAAPASTKNSTLDAWGNVKVPMLERLPAFSEQAAEDWLPVNTSDGENPPIYTSLLGLPIANLRSSANSTFNIETSYWYLDCPDMEEVDTIRELESIQNSTGPPPFPKSTAEPWTAVWGEIASNTSSLTPSGEYRCNSTDPLLPLREIQYVGWNGDDAKIAGMTAKCTIQTSYVELSVGCLGWNCSVVKMRRSTLPHKPVGYTTLDSCHPLGLSGGYAAFDWFAGYFALITDGNRYTGPTALQVYFFDPGNPFNLTAIDKLPLLYTLDNQSFATSLVQLLNTYWISSIGATILTVGHASSFDGLANTFGTIDTNFLPAVATVSSAIEVMVCNFAWVVTLLIATLAMFVAGIVKMRLDALIWMPDLSMNISTLTRNNLLFGLPVGGSTISDKKRSKMLKEVRARFGEVKRGDEVSGGSLAIGACIEEGDGVAKFGKDRECL